MRNPFQISEEEKNRIRGLHLTESKDKRITSILNEDDHLSAGKVGPDSDKCLRIEFESGESEVQKTKKHSGGRYNMVRMGWEGILRDGLRGDRPFIKIKAGVSAPGNSDDNQTLIDKRVNAGLEYLLDILSGVIGPTGLSYSAEALKNKSIIEKVYGTEEAGSILTTGERIPDDPTDEYFEDAQYVEICYFNPGKTPGYDSLADEFMEATIRNNLGYSEETVYEILDKLRDRGDFEEFSDELERSYGMDFYDIACDKIAQDLTPDWFDKIIGKDPEDEVVFATEIGPGDTTINVHLKRLGVRPIEC